MSYKVPPPLRRPVSLPQMARASIDVVGRLDDPQFAWLRGQGNFGIAALYLAAGNLAAAVLRWLLLSLLDLRLALPFTQVVLATFCATVAWAGAVAVSARLLNLLGRERDDLATATAIGWVPMLIITAVLTALLGGLGFIGPLTVIGSAVSTILIVLLFYVSQKAIRSLFQRPFEESFAPVAWGLILYSMLDALLLEALGRFL